MRNIIALILFISVPAITVIAQDTTRVDPVTYSKVIQADSLSKDALYSAIYDWFIANYKSANDAIQTSDKETGIIVGKGVIIYDYGKTTYSCYKGYIKYTIRVSIKDNRYKVEIENFYHTVNLGSSASCALGDITTAAIYTDKGIAKSMHNAVWADIKTKLEKFSGDIFTSLEDQTKKTKSGGNGENW
jgi:hypothetical protein